MPVSAGRRGRRRRSCVRTRPLGVGAGAGVAVAALVLATRTTGARVVAADLGEVVAHARAGAGLHVRPAVHGRGRVLQPLRASRGERGGDRCVLALAAGSVLATRRGAGPPGVGAAAGSAVAPGLLALGAADAAVAPRCGRTALSTPAGIGLGRPGPGRRPAA